ncbi:MAG: M6 family metalloprotease domain-containing protein, partial [Caldilineae bacterium]
MNPKNLRKTAFLALSAVLAIALLAVAFALLAGPSNTTANADAPVQQRNARQILDSVRGRRFPNLAPPRDDLVAARAAGVPLNASRAELDAALADWYARFNARHEKSGPNPMAFAARMKALAEAEAQGRSVKTTAVTGTAKMLMIPIEFTGTDQIAGCPSANVPTQTFTAIVSGPLHGTIPDPSLEGDNNSMYAPNGNFTIQWYKDLMFGNGVGVVRTDLNNGAGVDLSGVSATKWYEEQSEGQYVLSGTIYSQWVPLPHSVAWYGWDGDETDPDGRGVPCGGTPSGYGFEFAIDAANKINQMDPNFDWSQFDLHGPGDQGPPDGIVDHLMFIHAGVDNSAGGGTYGNYQIWAHSWDVFCDNNGDGDIFDPEDYGCLVQGGDTPTTTDDIYIANYTVIPEDADIGVVVHEYGHDIGLPDYYDQTGTTSNSTAHWIVMSGGSWSGALGGSHPAPFNPWARWFFGWEQPLVLSYTTAMTEVTIGQSEPTPNGTYDSVKIELPDQLVQVDNLAGTGKGLHSVLGNLLESSLSKTFDLSGATNPVFTFTTYFDIEEDWDYTYVRVSTDGGQTWTNLLNEEGVYATSDPNGSFAWKGAGGLTGQYSGKLTYDLSAYAGQSAVMLQFLYATDQAVQQAGIWLDDFLLKDGGNTLYTNDLEDASDWTFSPSEWEVVPYDQFLSHYYILEWRNDHGSIAQEGQTQQYYSLAHSQSGWKVDKFSANVPGLLVWYRNNKYENNQAVAGGREFDPPATGPKGQLLVVDSHYEPIPWSGGWWNAGQLSNRRGAMDAAFGLNDVPAWMIHDNAVATDTVMDFGSRPAVPEFNDALRSVPGWVFVSPYVYRADRSASVVIPAEGDYTTRIRALGPDGNPDGDLTAFWGYTVGGQELGSGNPGDSGVQFGVHARVITQATDGTWGKVKIWNAKAKTNVSPPPPPITQPGTYTQTYYANVQNVGSNPITTNVTIAVPGQVSVQNVTPSGYTTSTQRVADVAYSWSNYQIQP